MASAEEDRGNFIARETSSAPALAGSPLELELDRYLRALKYTGTTAPSFASNHQIKILFSDLVTAEFRGRKPDPEFPMNLDSLESFLHRQGFLNTDYVFLPSVEAQRAMRQSGQRLLSLGARGQRRISPGEAHIWGINMMNYLQATALFSLLQLAGIPFLREERADSFPLIVLGGHIWPNPLPLSRFYDVMVLGDGEQTLADIANLTAELSGDKPALLAEIAKLAGTHVPGITQRATRCAHIDFENPGFAGGSSYLLNGVGALVLSRGCPYDCAFCLNGLIGGQYRVKPFSQILEQIDHMKRSGAQKLMLLAASASSYRSEGKTIEDVIRYVEDQGMTIRTMSDRPESLTRAYLEQSMKEKKKVIFAPEASPRIRHKVLHKTLTEETLWRGISLAIEAGISHIQLYIILCIPPISPGVVDFLPHGFDGEQEEDLRYVAGLAMSIVDRMKQAGTKVSDGKPRVTLDCMPFVPAIGTRMQKVKFPGYEEYRQRLLDLQALIGDPYAEFVRIVPGMDEATQFLQSFLERSTEQAGLTLWQVWQETEGEDLELDKLKHAAIEAGFDLAELHREFDGKRLPYEEIME